MFTHGMPKLGKFSQNPIVYEFFWNWRVSEPKPGRICGGFLVGFVLLGLGTRFALIPLSITMVVALLHVHIVDPFSKQELAWHYLLVYAVLFILGSGKYSLDHLLFKRGSNLVSKMYQQ